MRSEGMLTTKDSDLDLDAIYDVPATVPVAAPVPPAELTLGDKLQYNTSLALDRQRELLELGVHPEDHRQNRIVADVAQATVKTSLQAETNALQVRRDDFLPRIIVLLKAEAKEMRLIDDADS
jgi:hypothetical protein